MNNNNNNKKVYSVLAKKKKGEQLDSLIKIDFSHSVFEGHFPQKPVLPGVMMCDIIKHEVSDLLGLKVQLTSANNIKFSRMIIPSENNTYNVNISMLKDEIDYHVRANISQKDQIFFKINAIYKAK